MRGDTREPARETDGRCCAEGYKFYERCGFVRTSEDLAAGAVAFTPMKRSPVGTGKVSIHRVTDPAELPSLAPVHRDAFSPHTMHKLIWGKVAKEDDNRWMANSLADSLANPREPIFKAVDEQGQVVGFALWKVPPQDGEEGKGAEGEKPMDFAEGTNVELAKEFFDKLDVVRKTYSDEGPHVRAYYLSDCGIVPADALDAHRPEHPRRLAGSAAARCRAGAHPVGLRGGGQARRFSVARSIGACVPILMIPLTRG